jgi:hypothetical protein
MKPNVLPIAFSNSGVRLEEILNLLHTEPPQEKVYGFICLLYRRLAAGALLMDGDPARFFEYLYKGARAYAHFLEIAPPREKATSKAEAFYDAVACHDDEAARRMTTAAPSLLSREQEYEEDFFAIRLLMDRFFGSENAGTLRPSLEQWAKLADGNPDARLAVCQALIEGDQVGFDAGVTVYVRDRKKRLTKLRETEQLDPDEASTTAHVSTELLAWLDLAERAGLRVKRDYPFAPALARSFNRLTSPAPDSWRTPEPFSAFDA